LFELGRHEEALAGYDRALAIRPDFAEAHHGRGNALFKLKRYEEALAGYDRALAIRPDLAPAHHGRVDALFKHALFELERDEEAQPARAGMKTIGLCMIAKDEAHVITRCLDSARSLADYVLVVDTGSTDGTQQIVRDWLEEAHVAGAVVEEPWRDFAHNRSFALAELRKRADIDYALIIDADDVLELDAGFAPEKFKSEMTHDLYDVPVFDGPLTYSRPHICRNRLPFSFRGVLHEYLETPSPGVLQRTTAAGIAIRSTREGARNRNPRKYQDDAALLERALASETDPFLISRYIFYLAQSYMNCGEREKALANYLKRAELGDWIEEVYVSLFEAGNLMAALERPYDEVIATYLRAADLVPRRAEALHAASRYCRAHGKYRQGYEIAARGIGLKPPEGALFAQPWIYDYGLLDEYARNAYAIERYQDCLDAYQRLLCEAGIPEGVRERAERSAALPRKRLAEQAAARPQPRRERRCAFITPYYTETRPLLERCVASVRSQTIHADHILVADGFPQDWIDQTGVRHVRLDRAHADWGNTPRCLGALMAAAEGYDAIGFLDADCWLEPDHLESCLASLEALAPGGCAYVIAGRTLHRPDGSVMNIADEPPETHADTNSLLLLPAAYPLLSVWALVPRELAHIGDRVFFLALKSNRLNAAFSRKKTVNYTCTYASFYRALGEEPPQPVKEKPDQAAIISWIKQLSEAELAAVNDRVRTNIRALYELRPLIEALAGD
jgi:glycosyltransferase involved in cell wall biosynthesis